MIRARTFEMFLGSTKGLLYTVYDSNNNILDATNVSVKLYDDNMTLISDLEVLLESSGVFKVIIDSTTLNLQEGKYILEFSCIANGHNYVRRDYLLVKQFI